ncbi:MAG: OmpH family outer membrane protein [Spirochaetales bacterium]|nr:OmpH family outer membrane protein [Spirochaetales bacterium]
MKKHILILLLFTLGGLLFSQQITRMAVVDYSRLLSVYYQDSRKIKEVNDFENEIIEELASIADEITDLEEKKIDAQKAGDETKVLSYDELIEQKKKYQQDYLRIKKTQLNNMKEEYASNLSMTSEIYDAIAYVAESQGFSFVMKKSDPDLVWWSPEVDITDAVLTRLSLVNR